jgi:hypothetical protein
VTPMATPRAWWPFCRQTRPQTPTPPDPGKKIRHDAANELQSVTSKVDAAMRTIEEVAKDYLCATAAKQAARDTSGKDTGGGGDPVGGGDGSVAG